MSVSIGEVRRIANLARLRFSEQEEEEMADQLNRVLDYVDKLSELDTQGVEPMSHVLDVYNRYREDEVEKRIDREDALSNSPDADRAYFRVPKFVE